MRDTLPLLFCGDELVWAARVGTAKGFLAHENEPGIEFSL
jgi:hypothetical protein